MQIKNIKQLRDSLLTNYEKIENKKMPMNMAKELANTAGKILSSVKTELSYNTYMNKKDKIEFLEVNEY